MIPKIIHQIWLQGKKYIPQMYNNYSEIWENLNYDDGYISSLCPTNHINCYRILSKGITERACLSTNIKI